MTLYASQDHSIIYATSCHDQLKPAAIVESVEKCQHGKHIVEVNGADPLFSLLLLFPSSN